MKNAPALLYMVIVSSKFLVLFLLPKSTADFIPGDDKCFKDANDATFKFNMRLHSIFNFVPTPFTLKISSMTFKPDPWTPHKMEKIRTIVHEPTACTSSAFPIYRHTADPGFYSFTFVVMSFGKFVIDHFKINVGQDGVGEVVGSMERARIGIIAGVQAYTTEAATNPTLTVNPITVAMAGKVYTVKFFTYLNQPLEIIYFKPNNDQNLQPTETAVIELVVVDKKGEAVPNVAAIMDLVQITAENQPATEKPAKLFISADLKPHFVRAQLFDHQGNVKIMAIHPLDDASTVPTLSGINSSIKTFTNTVVEDKDLDARYYFGDVHISFMTTVPETDSCVKDSKKAFLVRHKKGTETVSTDSQHTKEINQSPKILYLTKLIRAQEKTCKAK